MEWSEVEVTEKAEKRILFNLLFERDIILNARQYS